MMRENKYILVGAPLKEERAVLLQDSRVSQGLHKCIRELYNWIGIAIEDASSGAAEHSSNITRRFRELSEVDISLHEQPENTFELWKDLEYLSDEMQEEDPNASSASWLNAIAVSIGNALQQIVDEIDDVDEKAAAITVMIFHTSVVLHESFTEALMDHFDTNETSILHREMHSIRRTIITRIHKQLHESVPHLDSDKRRGLLVELGSLHANNGGGNVISADAVDVSDLVEFCTHELYSNSALQPYGIAAGDLAAAILDNNMTQDELLRRQLTEVPIERYPRSAELKTLTSPIAIHFPERKVTVVCENGKASAILVGIKADRGVTQSIAFGKKSHSLLIEQAILHQQNLDEASSAFQDDVIEIGNAYMSRFPALLEVLQSADNAIIIPQKKGFHILLSAKHASSIIEAAETDGIRAKTMQAATLEQFEISTGYATPFELCGFSFHIPTSRKKAEDIDMSGIPPDSQSTLREFTKNPDLLAFLVEKYRTLCASDEKQQMGTLKGHTHLTKIRAGNYRIVCRKEDGLPIHRIEDRKWDYKKL